MLQYSYVGDNIMMLQYSYVGDIMFSILYGSFYGSICIRCICGSGSTRIPLYTIHCFGSGADAVPALVGYVQARAASSSLFLHETLYVPVRITVVSSNNGVVVGLFFRSHARHFGKP